jgi:hypothetical protein
MVVVLASDSSRSRSSVTNVSLSFISNVLFTVKYFGCCTFCCCFLSSLFDLSASKNQLRGDVVPISCYAPTERGGPPREKIKSFSIFFPNDRPVGCRFLAKCSSHVPFSLLLLLLISFPVHPLFWLLPLYMVVFPSFRLPSSGAKSSLSIQRV